MPEVDYDGPWRLTLPRSLVFTDGERVLEGRGRMLVRFLFDQGRASVDTEEWGEVLVWAGGRETAVPVIPGSRTDAPYAGGEDPGFNPYRDTPSFANFERTLFSHLTKGTCVGIALVVKLFFEKVDFGNSSGIPADFLTATNVLDSVLTYSRVVVASSLDFRDLTSKQPDLVMDLMSALHLENLNPLNIRDTLRAVMLDDDSSGTLEHIWENLAAGRVPVIAGFRLKKRVWKTWNDIKTLAMLDSGHAFLVYRGWRFGSTSVFAVYDPNLEYLPETPRLTTLVFPPEGRPFYRVNDEIQQSLVRFLPLNSSGLFTFVAMIGQGARLNLQEAGRSVIDSYRILTLE